MKKTLLYTCALIVLLSSCAKDLEYYNRDPKNAEVAPSATLFSGAEKALADNITSPSVNLNIFRLLAQQWTETTYTDESNYDINTRPIPQNWWDAMYADVIRDLNEAKRLTASENISDEQKAVQIAQADVLEIYTYTLLVNTFGNVPYSQAMDIENVQPKYDDAAEIYAGLIERLNAATTVLAGGESGYSDADLIYSGDADLWTKFANSLKLRIALTLADANPAQAKTLAEQAATNVFSSNADNATFRYLGATPNTNPIWVNLVQSGRNDFVPANTLVDEMNRLNDPRRSRFFTIIDGAYKGGIYGASNDFENYSHVAAAIQAQSFPTSFLDYSEVEFYLAEAVERGFNVGGDAETHYNNAITASIVSWGGTAGDASAYLGSAAVKYESAAGDYKQKIGMQKWIALYNRGIEAWTEQRRLDYPQLEAPSSAVSAYPLRLTYPVIEQSLNPSSYQEASSAIGGDRVTTRLFWDKQ